MRIVRVEVEILEVPFREPVISGTQRWEQHRAGVLILRTDDGRKGLAEFPAPRPHDLGEDVSPRLIEVLTGIELSDPVAVEGTLRDIDTWPFVGRAARSAVESALIDLLARVSRQPIAEYLDRQARSDVAVNALLGMDQPEETAAQAAALVEDGFGCLKLKAGEEPDGALEARVRAVREAVGPDVALRLDFNGSLSADWAEDALAKVAPFDIEYAEQPIPPGAGAEALARLRWTGAVPIAADESVRDLGAARVLLDTGAVDALVVKPARVGGLRQARAIIDLAAAAEVPVTVSTLFETGVGLAGALHLAATVPGSQAHGLATAGLLESDLLETPLVISRGRMSVPVGMGLGVDLDRAALERYQVR
ncbi:MAG: mandelate racemase/muconate lactonizing enzyme family protein [Candidatus Limnocylindrales bacterium]